MEDNIVLSESTDGLSNQTEANPVSVIPTANTESVIESVPASAKVENKETKKGVVKKMETTRANA
ncbi:MAG: hypothetical protein LBF01_05260 [Bacteroidales bacterium]|nr:hypothetical protein [Bacteroidales bacterium]